MAHDLASINGKVAMAYQNEMPWHRLGTKLPAGTIDVPAAMRAASLDHVLTLTEMYIDGPKGKMRVPRRRAVVRDVDSRIISVVSDKYQILQNAEAFEVLQPACEQFGVTIETAGALGNGDRVWMLAKMPDTIEPVKGDIVEGYALVMTGHNGWTPYTARLTPVRTVCANTIALAMRDHAFIKLTHVRGASDRLAQVEHMMTNLVAALKASGVTFAKLAGQKMTDRQLNAYIKQVLGVKLTEEMQPVVAARHATILELAKNGKGVDLAPGTVWAAFNAVTEYVDHVRPAEVKAPRMLTQANSSALFGLNARVKNRALVLAQKVAA